MGAFLMPWGRQQLANVEKWLGTTRARPADWDIRTRREPGCPTVDPVTTTVGCSWAVAMAACLHQSPVEAFEGERGGTNATSARGSTVQVCPVEPLRRDKPVQPAWKTGLGINLTVMAVEESLGQTTAPPRPRPVTVTAGVGNDAALAGAHQNTVQKCPVTSPRRQTPAVAAKQANRVMESTVTTVRGSLGLAPLDPSPVATAAGKGRQGCSGGRSAAGLGTGVVDGPEEATLAQEAVVHTNQGNGLRPCSPSAMRARLGGARQPQEGGSGKREVGLGMEVLGSSPVAGENHFEKEECADVEELAEWWQDQEKGWDSDTVLDEWDSVRTGDGFTEVHATLFVSADDWPLDVEGQLLVWDCHVLLRDLRFRGAVHQVPVHMDGDYGQFAAWCPDQLENVIFIAGATVLVKSVSLRDLGVVPGMLLEMRARLTGGAGDSHPMAALAGFRVQKYETWREYLAGSPMTARALTRAIEKMIGRFAGDLPSLLTNVSVTCPGLEPEHMWTLLGCTLRERPLSGRLNNCVNFM